MVYCFAPACNHSSRDRICSFHSFPADVDRRRVWARAICRGGRKPGLYSRLCSCHFPRGLKETPVLFVKKRIAAEPKNDHSYCLSEETPENGPITAVEEKDKDKEKKEEGAPPPIAEEEEEEEEGAPLSEASVDVEVESSCQTMEEELEWERRRRVQLEIRLEQVTAELEALREQQSYSRERYSASRLSAGVLHMETGLPGRDVFDAVCSLVARSDVSISYRGGRSPEELTLEDQILMTFMKLRHDYTPLHLAALFRCSAGTVRNVAGTFTDVLHRLFLADGEPSEVKSEPSLHATFLTVVRNAVTTGPNRK